MSCRLVTGIGLRDGAAGAACELTTGGDHPPGRLDGRTLWPGMATRLRRDVWVEQCEERGVRGVRLVALGDRRGEQVGPLWGWGLHFEGEKVCAKSKFLALDNRTESLSLTILVFSKMFGGTCTRVRKASTIILHWKFRKLSINFKKNECKRLFSRLINGINKFHDWLIFKFFKKH